MNAPNLLEAMTQALPELRKSDRKVAQTILADPKAAIELKMAELASHSGVSEPTVLRFCAAIGCDGFQDMRLKLAKSLAFGLSTSQAAITDDDNTADVVQKIFEFNLTSLDWVRSKLDTTAIELAIDAIVNARSLHFIGLGASGIVAQDAQQKFPLFAIPTHASVDVHQMLISASMMQAGDVLVAISHSGTTREIIQAAREARQQGAIVICIVGGDCPLLRHGDIPLLIETLENTDHYTPTISRVAALVIIDILSTIVAQRRGSAERKRVAYMKRLLADVRASGLV